MEAPWTTQPHPLASPEMCFLLDFSLYLPECKYFVLTTYALVDSPPINVHFVSFQFFSMTSML